MKRSGQLVEAARQNKFELVEQLLRSGSPVDERDEHGGTALMYAVAAQNEEAVRNLGLDQGVGHFIPTMS